MCVDPLTATAIAAAVTQVVGGVVGGVGEVAAGRRQARVLEREAKIAESTAFANELLVIEETRDAIAGQRVGFSAAGLSGVSADALLEETAISGALDAANVVRSGVLEAYGFRTRAAISRHQGRAALINGVLGAGAGSLLSASNIGGRLEGADTGAGQGGAGVGSGGGGEAVLSGSGRT